MLAGFPPSEPGVGDSATTGVWDSPRSGFDSREDSDAYLLAKSYLDIHEFHRAAHVLSSPVGRVAAMKAAGVAWPADADDGGAVLHGQASGPAKGLSPKEMFVRHYALYMAGERAREQEVAESSGRLSRVVRST